jgi:UDP-glucose 4-epimerase
MAKTILVTGGAGFIGRRVVSNFMARGDKCIVVDNLFTGIGEPESSDNLEFLKLDISSPEIGAVFENHKIDSVVHLAAIHHIPTCEGNPELALKSNILGTQNILGLMRDYDIGKLFLASSGAVYDWQEKILCEESSPIYPRDIYSISKTTNEYQVSAWQKLTGGRAIIGRIFNTIGHDDPNGHLIPDILQQIKENTANQTVYLGNTNSRRDYIHADDTAEAIVRLHDAELDKESPIVVNICNGAEYSVEDIVDCISECLHIHLSIRVDPSRKRKVDRISQVGSNSKMEGLIGWLPRSDFREAVFKTVSSLRDREK